MELAALYKNALQALRPKGVLWENNAQGSFQGALAETQAEEFAGLHETLDALPAESDPASAQQLLDEWCALYGLEDGGTLTREERRQKLLLLRTRTGGQSAAYFQKLIETLGYTGRIVETIPFTCNLSECNGRDILGSEEDIHHWYVVLDKLRVVLFRCGESGLGDHFADYPDSWSDLEALLGFLKPAHTEVHIGFNLSET